MGFDRKQTNRETTKFAHKSGGRASAARVRFGFRARASDEPRERENKKKHPQPRVAIFLDHR
jgi:hypothetical protein